MGDYIRILPVMGGSPPAAPSTLPPAAPEGFALPEKKPKAMHMPGPDPHFHLNKLGLLEACYHRCRTSMLSWGFWLGMTAGFPLEHLIWQKTWPFYLLTHWLGVG